MIKRRDFSGVKICAAVLACLGLIELSARTYFNYKNPEREYAKLYPAYLMDFNAKLDHRFIRLYTINPTLGNEKEYRFDAWGCRLDRFNLKLGEHSPYKLIWMFGGSTTQGLGLRENETISAHLNELLEKENSKWRVINLGQGGYTSTEELLLLTEHLQKGLKPDAILVYDGINEVAVPPYIEPYGFDDWQMGTPKANILGKMDTGHPSWPFLKEAIRNITRLDEALGLFLQKSVSIQKNLTWSGNWEKTIQRHLISLLMIKATTHQLGIPAFFYFQPTMQYEEYYHLRRFSPYEKEKVTPWMRSNEYQRREALYYPQFSSLRKSLAPHFFDIYDVFKGKNEITLYHDPRHPNETGTQLIAQRIFNELKKLP